MTRKDREAKIIANYKQENTIVTKVAIWVLDHGSCAWIIENRKKNKDKKTMNWYWKTSIEGIKSSPLNKIL